MLVSEIPLFLKHHPSRGGGRGEVCVCVWEAGRGEGSKPLTLTAEAVGNDSQVPGGRRGLQ